MPSCVDGPCTQPTIQIVLGSDNVQCKVDIKWTCGTRTYEIFSPGKGRPDCDPGTDPERGFRAVCLTCGRQSSAFDSTDPEACSCFDPAKLIAMFSKACGFPM